MGEETKGKLVVCGICGIKIGEQYTEKVAYPTSKGVICGNCKDNPPFRGDVRYRYWGKVMKNRLGIP
jgi:hypothetical protein